MGLSLRPADQCHRRPRQPAATEDRPEFRSPAASYGARRGLLPARHGLGAAMFDSMASSGEGRCVAASRVDDPRTGDPKPSDAGTSRPARPINGLGRLGTSLLASTRATAAPGGVRRLVRTHAFRLAALYFLVFALSVSGVLFFVYWATADFVERQTEATLTAEVTGLAEQYAQRGLSGLVQIVAARSAGDRGDGMLYLVTNPQGRPLAGNITHWPAGVAARSSGVVSFQLDVQANGYVER